jgi:putative SOS response-associated peptidase YedK
MCGRFTITVSKETLEHYLQESFDIDASLITYEPNYNVAPSQQVLSVINDGKHYRVGYLNWGFKALNTYSNQKPLMLINARQETIEKKPTFKQAFKERRCLFLADGFYEWNRHLKDKQPYHFKHKSDSLFAFAGLYEAYIDDHDKKVFGGLIITTSANQDIEWLHERMPLILSKDAQKKWLNKHQDIHTLKGLLEPLPNNTLVYYPVSKEVNRPSFNQSKAIQPIKL